MHTIHRFGWSVLACAGLVVPMSASATEGRRIEEVIVTAEKREATVSDTSISITAFAESMIEDFGIQGADELVNFIPATTRDEYDIRIRGVGRNFRALGGDPGVATYYNGVYSEDFGIASSENGLYDVARIEVLRGPQGTLYGRNSIGGALNYITNRPTYEWEGEVRALVGNLGAREYYGIVSGPLIKDRLAARIVGLKRDRDGSIDGDNGSKEINTIDDQNVSIALNWQIADNWEANLRWNDRKSDRVIGQSLLVTQGPLGLRGELDPTRYAYGLRPVTAATPGALPFTNPVTGAVVYGAPPRPGIDQAATFRPRSFYGVTTQRFDDDIDDLKGFQATNDNNNERFVHNAVQFDLTWDINDTTSLKYIGGWMDFDYTFDIDNDWTNGTVSQFRQTVLEAVETHSHELQLLWQIGDNLQMTSGLYYFNSKRLQNYAFKDLASQGRFTQPVDYGTFGAFIPFAGAHARLGDAPLFGSAIGRWEGDPNGAFYEYVNTVETDAYAAYTQGTYTFNEQWALTLGIRWAKDEKTANENRTAYFEQAITPDSFMNYAIPIFNGICASFGIPGVTSCGQLGWTPLSTMNWLMGNGTPGLFVGQPASPIIPACALDDPECSNPLRLVGVPFSFADRTQGKDDWKDVTWRVNLDWTPNDNTLVYLSATTGYRAGGYSLGLGDSRGPDETGAILPSTYDKEEIIAYELGYKGTFLDGRLQVNTSVYQYDFDNYQDWVDFFDPNSGTSVSVVQNADEAQNRGIEVELIWLPTDSWTIGGNGSWSDTEYKSDFFVLENDNPALPMSVFDDTSFLVRNLKGNPLKRIPEWKYTIWSSYDWQFNTGTLTGGAVWSYTGDYYSSGIERSLDKVPSRDQLNLYLTWRDSREQWYVRAFVDNVFDDISVRGIGATTAASDWQLRATSLYPRFYGLDVTYRMGR
jgi:iron complex outermembrane recepter protein